MAQYILLIREDLTRYPLPNEELNAIILAHRNWAKQLIDQGVFVSGHGVDSDGRLIEMINGDLIVQPIRDVHAGIGGYYIVECNDLYDAVAIAKGCPTYKDGDKIEVRRLM